MLEFENGVGYVFGEYIYDRRKSISPPKSING